MFSVLILKLYQNLKSGKPIEQMAYTYNRKLKSAMSGRI